jgi:hypothetical protein
MSRSSMVCSKSEQRLTGHSDSFSSSISMLPMGKLCVLLDFFEEYLPSEVELTFG